MRDLSYCVPNATKGCDSIIEVVAFLLTGSLVKEGVTPRYV